MTGRFRIDVLSAEHDRAGFDCGNSHLDRYLKEQASQDVRRRMSACYVALDNETGILAAYYTLCAGSVPLTDVPAAMAKKLPRYPVVPVARLGRLAVSQAFQGKQLGAALLWDAGARASRSEVAVFALVVDATDEMASAFYRHHGFTALGSNPLTFVLPVASFVKSA